MCYYSTTMRNTRDAKVGEDLHLGTHLNHAVLRSTDDHAVVCVKDGTTVHIESLHVNEAALPGRTFHAIRHLIGTPVTAKLVEYNPNMGYASDALLVDGHRIALCWMRGMKCYIGPKKVPLETKMGVDEQTLRGAMLDHRELVDAPTMLRSVARALGVCSITR